MPMPYSKGKISDDDEGDVMIAIAVDTKRQVVRIRFNEPVLWMAMEKNSVIAFANKLLEKANQLNDEQQTQA
jgi:hypothetical protein